MRGWWINPDTGMMRQNRHYACIPIKKKGLPMGSKEYSIIVKYAGSRPVFGSKWHTISSRLPYDYAIPGSKLYSVTCNLSGEPLFGSKSYNVEINLPGNPIFGSQQYSIDANMPDRNVPVFGSSLFTIDVELPVARTSIFGSQTYSISGGE